MAESETSVMDERDSRRNMWILTIGMFLMSVGYTMVIPFLPIYLLELGVSDAHVALWSGLVFSVAFLIAGIMAPIWGKMSDKRGRKLMVIRAGFALGFTYILGGFVHSAWQLFIVRALQGFANGFLPAAMTLITTSVPTAKVGYALGIFQTGMIAGQVIGPLAGGTMAKLFGMRPAFFIVGAVMTAVSVVVVKWVKEPKASLDTQNSGDVSIIEDLKIAWKNKKLMELLILFFVVQGSIIMLQPVATLYIGELVGSVNDAGMATGIILSIGGSLGAMMTPLWGKFGQQKGYYLAVCIGLISGGTLTGLQGIFPDIWVFGILQAFIGILAYGTVPSLSAAITLCTTPETRGRAFGLVTTSQQLGSMVGPLLASAVTYVVGLKDVYVFSGVIMLCTAFIVWRRHGHEFGNKPVTDMEKS